MDRLRRVSAAGGEPMDMAVPDSARGDAYRFPDLLPDGHAALFTAVTDSGPSLRTVSLSDGIVRPLGQRGMSPHYVSGGYLAYVESDGTLFAAPFDARQLRITGPPKPIADNLRLGPAQVAKLGMARTGCARLSGWLGRPDRNSSWWIAHGRSRLLSEEVNWYSAPRYSPDGSRIAVTISVLGSRDSRLATSGSGISQHETSSGSPSTP